ncbi:MAG: type II toxin-antitoxin system VapC family toxin [Ignavibacteriota bacterium]
MPKLNVSYVLDSYAIITFFKRQPGWEEVEKLLEESATSGKKMFLSLINWGEIIYTRIASSNESEGERTEKILESFPIEIIPPDLSITRQAAIFKALGGISYADCFAAALAVERNAVLVTGDREFEKLENLGYLKVKWI